LCRRSSRLSSAPSFCPSPFTSLRVSCTASTSAPADDAIPATARIKLSSVAVATVAAPFRFARQFLVKMQQFLMAALRDSVLSLEEHAHQFVPMGATQPKGPPSVANPMGRIYAPLCADGTYKDGAPRALVLPVGAGRAVNSSGRQQRAYRLNNRGRPVRSGLVDDAGNSHRQKPNPAQHLRYCVFQVASLSAKRKQRRVAHRAGR